MANTAILKKNKRAIEKYRQVTDLGKKKNEDPKALEQEWLAATQGNTARNALINQLQNPIQPVQTTPVTQTAQVETSQIKPSAVPVNQMNTQELIQAKQAQQSQVQAQAQAKEIKRQQIIKRNPELSQLNPEFLAGGSVVENAIGGVAGTLVSGIKGEVDTGEGINLTLGAIVEALPLVGKLGNFVGATPFGRAKKTQDVITKEAGLISDIPDMVSLGMIDKFQAEKRISDTEVNINKMETKLRLLLNASPDARANPEQIDEMEIEILKAREAIQMTKLKLLNL